MQTSRVRRNGHSTKNGSPRPKRVPSRKPAIKRPATDLYYDKEEIEWLNGFARAAAEHTLKRK